MNAPTTLDDVVDRALGDHTNPLSPFNDLGDVDEAEEGRHAEVESRLAGQKLLPMFLSAAGEVHPEVTQHAWDGFLVLAERALRTALSRTRSLSEAESAVAAFMRIEIEGQIDRECGHG